MPNINEGIRQPLWNCYQFPINLRNVPSRGGTSVCPPPPNS